MGVIPTIFAYNATPTIDPFAAFPTPDATGSQRQRNLEARHAALKRLEIETKRWTHENLIPLDPANEARVMVTYISPELIEAVYLSNLLTHDTPVADFPTVIQDALNQIAAREQLIFLVTVILTSQSSTALVPHTVDISPHSLTLINAENLALPPGHDDHNLDQPVTLEKRTVSGFIYYPFAVIVNGFCTRVLDPAYNTKIVIETSSILVDTVENGPYSWTIPYSPLLNTWNGNPTPEYPLPPYFDLGVLSSLNSPPDGADNPDFWRDFARFVWGQITLEDY